MRWPTDSTGWLLLGALGLPWAAIAHVNATRTRAHGALSLALTTGMVLLAEVAVRHTQVGDTWVRTAGFERAQKEFQELLEIRRYRAYPADSFPAQPPAPDPSRQRIVALGGSSTGGAYQMDNLDLFWPRKLDARVAGRGWEVVNQGVGGWNTLHVRLYVESQLERLQPDLLALYVGHNDVMTHLPVPYRQLLAQYEATRGGGAAQAFGQATALFGRSRLYMGLTYAILALRDRGGAVAVPVADARENLSRIRDLAHARGAKVLFMTEGLSPDPTPLRDYRDMLRALAAEQGDLFLDAAEALHATRDPDLFIDDCHLTERGHVFLAEQVDTALSRAGWLPATP
jgi:lysophospholipase L1-like esterase